MTTAKIPNSDARREPRSNMFMMATIYSDAGSAPVKIRDLSSSGALVEGGVLPHPGTKIKLVRGSLAVGGKVAWSSGNKAGLEFDAKATVADWLPNMRVPAGQVRVDAIVHEFKRAAGTEPLGLREPCPGRVNTEELVRVRALLEELAEALADDGEVIARHGTRLQTLDLAIQVLGKLAVQKP